MSMRDRMLASLRASAVSETGAHRQREAVLKPMRDEVRKMELLAANPELGAKYVRRTAEQKAIKDAAYADYLVRHPAIAEKMIAEELTRTGKRVRAIEGKIGNAVTRTWDAMIDRGVTDEQTLLQGCLQAATGVETDLGLNPYSFPSPTVQALMSHLSGNPHATTQVVSPGSPEYDRLVAAAHASAAADLTTPRTSIRQYVASATPPPPPPPPPPTPTYATALLSPRGTTPGVRAVAAAAPAPAHVTRSVGPAVPGGPTGTSPHLIAKRDALQ